MNSLFEKGDTVILFLARLHSIKGADFLLDVFLQIFNNYPNLKLILAGPDQHNIQEKLKTKVDLAGAKNHVCIPGMITGDLKYKLLARADLFCSTFSGRRLFNINLRSYG